MLMLEVRLEQSCSDQCETYYYNDITSLIIFAEMTTAAGVNSSDDNNISRTRCRHLAIWMKRVVFDSGPFAPLREKVTPSTKLEVHNILHYRQRRTEPRQQERVQKTWWKLDGFWDMQADRQTDRHADCNTSHPYQSCRPCVRPVSWRTVHYPTKHSVMNTVAVLGDWRGDDDEAILLTWCLS